MKITKLQLSTINLVLQIDAEGKAKQYGLAELSIASKIFKEIKKCVEGETFVDGEIKLTSEEKVFITKLIDARNWTVQDAEIVFGLKEILK